MIPLSRSVLGAEEATALASVLESGRLVQGERVASFEQLVAERTGREHAIAVCNGTAALRIALEALMIGPGDRVLVPDLTWPSPAHAVLDLDAVPVLVDVDEHEWNISPSSLAKLPPPTLRGLRAAIVVEQFGAPARIRELQALLPDLPILVDSACALGSSAGNDACGSLGVISCLSFHPRKVVTTGEGGMCLTDDPELASCLRELRNHGQSSPGTFGRASSNYRMSEIAAAIGVVQLGRLSGMVEARAELAARYRSELRGLVEMQHYVPDARPNYQTFGIVLPEGSDRSQALEALRALDIEAGRLSYALHTLPQFVSEAHEARELGQTFPHSLALAERGVALPLWPGLSAADQAKVIEAVRAVVA